MNCLEIDNAGRIAAFNASPLATPLLPRPWLRVGAEQVLSDVTLRLAGVSHRCEQAFTGGEGLYVRGDIEAGGRTFRLAYWHRVPRALLG